MRRARPPLLGHRARQPLGMDAVNRPSTLRIGSRHSAPGTVAGRARGGRRCVIVIRMIVRRLRGGRDGRRGLSRGILRGVPRRGTGRLRRAGRRRVRLTAAAPRRAAVPPAAEQARGRRQRGDENNLVHRPPLHSMGVISWADRGPVPHQCSGSLRLGIRSSPRSLPLVDSFAKTQDLRPSPGVHLPPSSWFVRQGGPILERFLLSAKDFSRKRRKDFRFRDFSSLLKLPVLRKL